MTYQMLSLYTDIILKIGDGLSDCEKIYLTMTSKQMDRFKYRFIFKRKVHVYRIRNISYFDSFESVEISKLTTIYPKAARQIFFCAYSPFFPPIITHLRYDSIAPISNIPRMVTHITFSDKFNCSVSGEIPSSVTHLKFGNRFDQPIEHSIPVSVTHLKFGIHFNRPIEDIIPTSVTHLTLGFFFNHSINRLHQGIEVVKLSNNYKKPIVKTLKPKIKYLPIELSDT